MKKALIFDFDGTMVNFSHQKTNILTERRKERIIDLYSKYIRIENIYSNDYNAALDLIDLSNKYLSPYIAGTLNKAADVILSANEIEWVHNSFIYNYMYEIISELHTEFDFAIVSNNDINLIKLVLVQSNLIDKFKVVIGRDSPLNKNTVKPSPKRLKEALTLLDIKVNDAIYVGDTLIDMQAAKAINMKAIGVTLTGTAKEDLIKAGADEVYNDIYEFSKTLFPIQRKSFYD